MTEETSPLNDRTSVANESSRFLCVGNAAYLNRGCEAIIRGTMEILRREFGEDVQVALGSYGDVDVIENQRRNEIDPALTNFGLKSQIPRFTSNWVKKHLNKRFGTRFIGIHSPLEPHLPGISGVLEIGGDNYSLDYGVPVHLLEMDNFLQQRNLPVIIWGASIGPFDGGSPFYEQIFTHLRTVDAIFVRESYSRDYLAKNGLADNVHLMADPAFVMKPKEPDPEKLGFVIPEGAIGLNFSPLIAKYLLKEKVEVWLLTEAHLAAWKQLCLDMVLTVAESFQRDIVLVPHVSSMHIGIDDFRFLNGVAEEARKVSPNIHCVPDGFNAAEMKAIISRFHVFAGARTHSTIAALSSGVPTLSLSYSLKAKGLNQDLFGSQEHCLDSSKLDKDQFVERLGHLIENRASISDQILGGLPGLKQSAYDAGSALRKILDR